MRYIAYQLLDPSDKKFFGSLNLARKFVESNTNPGDYFVFDNQREIIHFYSENSDSWKHFSSHG